MKTSVIEARDMLSVLSVLGVEERIGEVPGVESVTVNFSAGSATVRYDETRLDVADIKSGVRQGAYDADAKPAASVGTDDDDKKISGGSPGASGAAAPKPPAAAAAPADASAAGPAPKGTSAADAAPAPALAPAPTPKSTPESAPAAESAPPGKG